MNTRILLGAIGLAMVACSADAKADRYNVSVPVGQEDGSVAYLMNFDTEEKMDSVIVTDGKAMFEGELKAPVLVRIMSNGGRGPMFFLESGNISFEENKPLASGTPLNDALKGYAAQMSQLQNKFMELSETDEAGAQAIIDRADALSDSLIQANIDNPLGYYLFLQEAYDMDEAALNAALEEHPGLKDYKRIQKVLNVFDRKAATSPGKMFTDFEITYEGKTSKLSDYVGKGKYMLVDFWASWCGPCRREAQVLKEIYNGTSRDQLDILGVAVWDEPENTLEAINDLGLPWNHIINAQTVPTDLYGILGIPCIILFAPDGTIVSRDQQGDDLKAAVGSALGIELIAPEVAPAE